MELAEGVQLRRLELADALGLLDAYSRNQEYLRPWEPVRDARFFTLEGQLELLRPQVEEEQAGRRRGWVLATGPEPDDTIVGRLSLTDIVRGPFRSANLGYWVDAAHTGRGLATAAVRAACRIAEQELGLHRVQAGTVIDNAGSQRVLARCGFERIGTAPEYLQINGAWRDHHLYQRILHHRPPQLP